MAIKLFLPIFILFSFAAAGAASAQPYVSANLGYASADFALGSPYNGIVDDRSVSYGVDIGLGFGRRWAIEAGVNGYGGFDGRATPCLAGAVCPLLIAPVSDNDITTYKLSLVPRINVGEVRLFGRIGYYRAKIDTEIDLPGNDFTENGLLLGAGVRWYFREPWSVSLEANRFDSNLYQITVGVGWGFRPLE